MDYMFNASGIVTCRDTSKQNIHNSGTQMFHEKLQNILRCGVNVNWLLTTEIMNPIYNEDMLTLIIKH